MEDDELIKKTMSLNQAPSISVIICSRDPNEVMSVRRNLLGTAKWPKSLEIIIIDNREKNEGLCAVYNQGAAKAKGRILVFMHEDVWMLEKDWDIVLLKKFRELPEIQILGVAGSSLLADKPWPLWSVADIPYTFGKVVHLIEKNEEFFLALYNDRDGDQEVVVLDGLWFAAKKTLFEKLAFDEKTFPAFHFYDIDICMQALEFGKNYATTDIRVLHKSRGSFEGEWEKWSNVFVEKWKDKLPVKTLNEPPLSKELQKAGCLDLRGKVKEPRW
ncbi:MAG: glycosyltransferase family protein [Fibromonadaceae bacterium]|jgi:glycosyltransferase involved in cell wall biosynthesis|nr:glycosyltransferase family protein [Fibromonadaceae bacterium]